MRGVPGQLTSNASPVEVESLVLEKSNAPFGVVLVSASDTTCRLPDKDDILEKGASTGVAVGIVVKQEPNGLCSEALSLPIGEGETVYAKDGSVVSLLRAGSIFVKTETAVKRNDAVYYRVVKTETTTLGAIRNDEDAGKAVKLNGAVFKHSAEAGDIVEVSLNLNTVQESY